MRSRPGARRQRLDADVGHAAQSLTGLARLDSHRDRVHRHVGRPELRCRSRSGSRRGWRPRAPPRRSPARRPHLCLPAWHAVHAGPDVRGARRDAVARRVRARAGCVAHPHPGRVRVPNHTITTAGVWSARVEVQGFASRRIGECAAPPWAPRSRSPWRRTGRSRWPSPRRSSAPRRFDGDSPWFDRPGRLQLRAGVRLHRDIPGIHVLGVRSRRAAICSANPGTAPKTTDLITPPGVSQATELDPTLGLLAIQPVLVPSRPAVRLTRATAGTARSRSLLHGPVRRRHPV